MSQCRAMSKRSRERCKKHALIGKNVCRIHGGASTGPKTEIGLSNMKESKTIHGMYTQSSLRELREFQGMVNEYKKHLKDMANV